MRKAKSTKLQLRFLPLMMLSENSQGLIALRRNAKSQRFLVAD